MNESIDKIRTRLRDMLFGRTKIRVVNYSESNEVTPVFVIGTFRSGTTLLRFLLDSHSEICCPPETKFLADLSKIHSNQSTWQSLEAMGLEENYIKQSLRTLASSFYQPYMAVKGKQVLVDKTPEYVRILDFIDWLYDGKCKFILIFRNGLDVANSMYEQVIEPIENNKSLDKAFNYWIHDTEIMLELLEKKKERCHKVIYNDLCDNVENVMTGVLRFIGLEWEEKILEWYSHGHDRGHEDIKARRQRGINKSASNYDSWEPETIKKFKNRAREVHEKIGFDPETLELR